MKFEIIEDHKSDNEAPIRIRKGTKVKVGQRSDDTEWPGWIYCCSLEEICEGWAPVQILKIEGEYGFALEDYSAKELVVKIGEKVEGNMELNGWFWCYKLDGTEEGWLPKEKLIVIHEN